MKILHFYILHIQYINVCLIWICYAFLKTLPNHPYVYLNQGFHCATVSIILELFLLCFC